MRYYVKQGTIFVSVLVCVSFTVIIIITQFKTNNKFRLYYHLLCIIYKSQTQIITHYYHRSIATHMTH